MANPSEASALALNGEANAQRTRNPERSWYRYALRLLPGTGSGAGPWLDLGCGQGEFLQKAAARGQHGLGLDLTPHNTRATLRAGYPAVVADLSARLPLADASLAGATLIEVIEHIACAEALMAELGRVIRPGGWLILTTPNIAHLTYRWRALTGHPPKQEGYHVRFFTRKTLSALLDTAGFERVASASYGKQALLTKLAKPLHGRHAKVHYRVPGRLEGLLARHFVWKLVRRAEDSDALRAEDLPSPS